MGKILSDTSEINVVIFENDAGSVEVKVHNESSWLTQSQMAELFATSTDNVGLHLKNIFIDEGVT